VAAPLWQGREQLVNQLLLAHDSLLAEAMKMSELDKNRVVSLTYKQEWASYEKLLNNLIFRNYRQILVDEDIKSAKKLIYFATALKNLPKSFKNETNSEENTDKLEDKDSESFGIEI
jgi:hypothetical protein